MLCRGCFGGICHRPFRIARGSAQEILSGSESSSFSCRELRSLAGHRSGICVLFVISWRPIYAAHAAASYFVIFTAISRVKFAFIREPLLFSDIALVLDVFKYKTIFYATKFNIIFWILAGLYVFGVSALYMIFEPTVLPSRHKAFWVIFGCVGYIGLLSLLFVRRVNRVAASLSEALLVTLKVRPNTVRFGTFTSVVLHFLVWLGKIVTPWSKRFLMACIARSTI